MTSQLLATPPHNPDAEIGPVLLDPKTCVLQPFYASLIIEWVEINKIRGLQVSPSHPNRIYDLDFIFKAASQRPAILVTFQMNELGYWDDALKRLSMFI